MRIRRRYAIPALTAAAVLAFAGLAWANNVSTENFKFTPSKAPKSTYKNGSIFVHTHTTYTHPGDKAHGGFAKTVTLLFDNDFKFNTSAIPKCAGTITSGTTLKQAYATCGPNAGASKNALVGTGTASTAPASNFTGCVAAFNGRPSSGNPTIVLFTRVTLAVDGTANCANPGSNTSGNTSLTPEGHADERRRRRLRQEAHGAEDRHRAAAAGRLHDHGEARQLRPGTLLRRQPHLEDADHVRLQRHR